MFYFSTCIISWIANLTSKTTKISLNVNRFHACDWTGAPHWQQWQIYSCWVFFFSLFLSFFWFLPPSTIVGSVIFSYVTETKASQECLFIEQRCLHFLFWMKVQNASKCGQKEGLLQCNVPKEHWQGACLCLYTCSVSPPMAICWLLPCLNVCD